ncbi:MAG: Asp-tRNA(Asn)/Glu-tRNA(Gln) amidotransferase GatCAB subunit B, partial [Gammaproteobacteria bacterium]|nr:Asp-tRNA(Asn)/Glu-tRNA(Gln) amidotransferase GatCAB subunit B [Gammaproteobacteria bacterium]
DHKRQRFMDAHGLRSEDAAILTESPDLAEYYESAVGASQAPAKLVANWVLVNLLGNLNKAELEVRQSPVSPAALGRLVTRIEDGTISGNIAKQVFEALWQSEDELDPDQVIEAQGLRQMTDSGEIEKLVDEIVAASPAQVEQYRSGKDKVFGYFVGQVMKATKGKANPQQVNELLRARLKAD